MGKFDSRLLFLLGQIWLVASFSANSYIGSLVCVGMGVAYMIWAKLNCKD